jgi:hypothetical protein
MNDQAIGVIEHLVRKRETLRRDLPQRGDGPVHHPNCKKPSSHTRFSPKGACITGGVARPECHAGDQVVKHELMEDDYASSLAQQPDYPGMRLGAVPYVIEGDV